MARLTGWWSRRSNLEKVELYTRWTYHSLAVIELSVTGSAVAQAGRPMGGWLLLAAVAHVVLVAVLASRAFDWLMGQRGRPDRLIAVVAALSVVCAALAMAAHRFGPLDDLEAAAYAVVGAISWGVGGVVLCLLKARHMLAVAAAGAVVTGLAGAALTLPLPACIGFAFAALFGGLAFAFTSGFSGWLLRAVRELDAARELQARLAVAEERLRFGRDLHDVMGRNLSVIALKSELAVQLARRGSTDRAVEQMAEVQHIAQESQREVRDVVRGYREADLRTELDGARGVLDAAGISCAIEVAGAELPARVQSALGWVVREATTNVLRHGDARRCTVSVAVRDGVAVLVVENDGTGAHGGRATPAGGHPGPGSGLAGLRERLAALGGTLDAGAADAGRFRVTARVPMAVREGAR